MAPLSSGLTRHHVEGTSDHVRQRVCTAGPTVDVTRMKVCADVKLLLRLPFASIAVKLEAAQGSLHFGTYPALHLFTDRRVRHCWLTIYFDFNGAWYCIKKDSVLSYTRKSDCITIGSQYNLFLSREPARKGLLTCLT